MSHGRILLVEDDDSVAEAIALVLRMDGYDVSCTSDPNDGLALAHEVHPGVIVYDPEILATSGAEFLTAVRLAPDLATTPVVLMTSGMLPRLRPGGSGVLLEPAPTHELFAAVHDGLLQPGATSA